MKIYIASLIISFGFFGCNIQSGNTTPGRLNPSDTGVSGKYVESPTGPNSVTQSFVSLAVSDTNIPAPTCDLIHRGQALYLKPLHKFVYCNESEWQDLTELNVPSVTVPTPAKPCSVIKVDHAATISCPDGSTVKLSDGIDGLVGPVGPSGEIGIQGPRGITGANGSPGLSGANGKNSLVRIYTEQPGANCDFGGKRIASGFDDGTGGGIANNGTLEAGEVSNSSYVCNGAIGATGPSGAQGIQGIAGTAGTNGSNGFNSLVSVVPELAGPNCPAGGVKVLSGVDNGANGGTARDGILQAVEAQSAAYVCNSTNNPLKIYTSLGVPLYQVVTMVPLSTGSSAGYATQLSLGIVVKSLNDNSYAAYIFGGDTFDSGRAVSSLDSYGSSGALTRLSVGTALNYANSTCSGQAYLEGTITSGGSQLDALTRNLLLKFPYSYLAFGSSEVTAGVNYQVQSGGASTRFVANGIGGCSSDISNSAGGIPVTVRASTFAGTIGAGWYVAP